MAFAGERMMEEDSDYGRWEVKGCGSVETWSNCDVVLVSGCSMASTKPLQL